MSTSPDDIESPAAEAGLVQAAHRVPQALNALAVHVTPSGSVPAMLHWFIAGSYTSTFDSAISVRPRRIFFFDPSPPYKSGAPYDFVPVNLSKSSRSDKAYLASRLVASLSGTISAGCTSISGTATVTHFDTHIVGCELSGGAGDCAQADSDFTDSNKPAYAAGSATLSLVKIPDAGTCADVRAAL